MFPPILCTLAKFRCTTRIRSLDGAVLVFTIVDGGVQAAPAMDYDCDKRICELLNVDCGLVSSDYCLFVFCFFTFFFLLEFEFARLTCWRRLALTSLRRANGSRNNDE